MKVVLVRYNAGNIRSVSNALIRLGVNPIVSDDPKTLMNADKVIFPGVGEAKTAMSYLTARGLDKVIQDLRQPVLGICLGMQLLCSWSEEGDTSCLGVFSSKVRRFQGKIKVPHMGWNSLSSVSSKSLLLSASEEESSYFYFVHSYACELGEYTDAACVYGEAFSAALQKDNFYAVQFHPEKSGEKGAQLLERFLSI